MKLRPRLSPTLDRFLGGHFLGPFFVCRDGPVFSQAELGTAFGREGL